MALKNKIVMTAGLIATLSFSAMAVDINSLTDKGTGKKTKNAVLLNIKSNTKLRSNVTLSLKTGLRYTGSQNSLLNNTRLSTYQKGNTVYIVPQKQKVLVPELKQGYTGLKLIITRKN